MRESRRDTIPAIGQELGLDPDSAGKGYEQIVSLMSENGYLNDVESPIDRARETQEITKPSTATQMIDYSLLDKVLAKIEISLRNNDRMRTHDC